MSWNPVAFDCIAQEPRRNRRGPPVEKRAGEAALVRVSLDQQPTSSTTGSPTSSASASVFEVRSLSIFDQNERAAVLTRTSLNSQSTSTTAETPPSTSSTSIPGISSVSMSDGEENAASLARASSNSTSTITKPLSSSTSTSYNSWGNDDHQEYAEASLPPAQHSQTSLHNPVSADRQTSEDVMISTYTRFEPDFETNPWLNEDEQEKSDDPNHADDTFEVEFTSPKPIAVEASTPSSLLKTGNNLQVPSQRLHKSYSQDSISSSVKDDRFQHEVLVFEDNGEAEPIKKLQIAVSDTASHFNWIKQSLVDDLNATWRDLDHSTEPIFLSFTNEEFSASRVTKLSFRAAPHGVKTYTAEFRIKTNFPADLIIGSDFITKNKILAKVSLGAIKVKDRGSKATKEAEKKAAAAAAEQHKKEREALRQATIVKNASSSQTSS